MFDDRLYVRKAPSQQDFRSQLIKDVRQGFALEPKQLPPKYFYDPDGSEIFEEITDLPEYYVTRAETQALDAAASAIIDTVQCHRLAELGSGSSKKTRVLLEAMHASDPDAAIVYAPLDISEAAINDAAAALLRDYDWLRIEAVIGDFLVDENIRSLCDQKDAQLLIFLGSTLGNMAPQQRAILLGGLTTALKREDSFLVGVDLVKDADVLYRAYNDSAGVTAEFNRNVIRVLRRELGANLDPEDFRHEAPYVAEEQRIEMRLYATHDLQVTFELAELPSAKVRDGEYILTELSCKFTREGFTAELEMAGLRVDRWDTDSLQQVAVALTKVA